MVSEDVGNKYVRSRLIMGMTRFKQMTYAQIPAVFVYGKAKDKTRKEKTALAMEVYFFASSGILISF